MNAGCCRLASIINCRSTSMLPRLSPITTNRKAPSAGAGGSEAIARRVSSRAGFTGHAPAAAGRRQARIRRARLPASVSVSHVAIPPTFLLIPHLRGPAAAHGHVGSRHERGQITQEERAHFPDLL